MTGTRSLFSLNYIQRERKKKKAFKDRLVCLIYYASSKVHS